MTTVGGLIMLAAFIAIARLGYGVVNFAHPMTIIMLSSAIPLALIAAFILVIAGFW